MKVKLHELLAVASNTKGQVEKVSADIVNLFSKKVHHFTGKITSFQPKAEGEALVVEEQGDLQTTVARELSWLAKHLQRGMDVAFQIAHANTMARADVVMEDGSVLISSVPATALLDLEKSITEIQKIVAEVPTLDPVKGFEPDPGRGAGVYQARPVTKDRTKKVKKVLLRHEATLQHPAQTEVYDADEPIGKIQIQEWSSMVLPAQKAEMLDRCEQLLRAVKKARSRANEAEIDPASVKVGRAVTDFLLTV